MGLFPGIAGQFDGRLGREGDKQKVRHRRWRSAEKCSKGAAAGFP